MKIYTFLTNNLSFAPLLILLMSSLILISQTNSEALSKKSKADLDLRYKNTKNTAPKEALLYADALHKLAIKENNQKNIATALYKKGYVENKLANNDIALQYIAESLTISRKIENDTLLLKNENLKGNIYLNKNLYNEAIDHYMEAKNIAERMGNTRDILVISRNVAILKKEVDDLDGALEIFLNNLERIEAKYNENFDRQKLLTYFSLVDTYLRLDDVKKASFYNNKGLEGSTNKLYSDLHYHFLSNEAIINYQQHNFEEAIRLCKKIENEIDSSTNSKLRATNYLYLGKSFFGLNNYETAILNFEKIKTQEDVPPFNLKEAYYYLAKSYIKLNNQDLANKNFDMLITLDNENDIVTRNAELKVFKTFDLANLKEELSTLNDKLSSQKRTAYSLYGLALVIIFGIVLFYRKKQKFNRVRFEKLVTEIEKLEQVKTKAQSYKKDVHVTDDNVIQILEKLDTFENNKTYLNIDCTLSYVAKKISTNTSYLSKVINNHKGIPFKTYLTDLRINEALIQLKNNKTLRAYTIKAIASEFGFKRQETFSRAFKARTGIYPSVYIKSIKIRALKL